MKLLDTNILNEGKIAESILVHSYDEYKEKGGEKDAFDTYAHFKERAKAFESNYISAMDMSLSGIPVEEETIYKYYLLAQAWWYLVHLWFNKPLRKVSYSAFDIAEFEKL